MNHRERMLAGLPYLANQDGLLESRMAAQELLYTYNNLPPQRWEEQRGLLEQLLGGIGENSTILPPLRCDYGKHIVVGRDVFTNYNLTILDVCQVTIGDRTLIGPNVSIYAAGHPIAPEDRATGWEFGAEVHIGKDVWIGGSCVILAGVTIGDGAVVGAGSVVTRDVPPNSIAVGNPARVLREITQADRDHWKKEMERYNISREQKLSGDFLLDYHLMLGNVALHILKGLRAAVMPNLALSLGGHVRG